MTSAGILLPNDLCLLVADGKRKRVPLSGLAKALDKPTDIAVVACEVARLTAPSEDALEEAAKQRLLAGSVHCYEELEKGVYQAFSIPEELLQRLRQMPNIRSVVPYGIVARDGYRAAMAESSSMIMTTVMRMPAPGAPSEVESLGIIDLLGDIAVLTAVHGDEIRQVRVLEAERDLEREIMVTMQSAGMPDARLVAHDESLAQALTTADLPTTLVQIAEPNAPTLAFLGLRKPSSVRFYLPAELARIRQQALRARERRTVAIAAGIAGLGILAAAAGFFLNAAASRDLTAAQTERQAAATALGQLYRDHFVSYAATRNFDLPQAWAELQLVLPPQLAIEQIWISPGRLGARLGRREPKSGTRFPPVTTVELRAATALSPVWQGATLQLLVEPHTVAYTLEKSL